MNLTLVCGTRFYYFSLPYLLTFQRSWYILLFMLNPPDFDTPLVAVDVETTGLHPFTSEIIEVGAVKFLLNGDALDEFETLIKPLRPIPSSATAIHGIHDDMVINSPSWLDVAPEFYDFIKGSILVAHNAMFDISFLQFSGMISNQPFPETFVIDTLTMSREIFADFQKHSLIELAYMLGMDTDSLHRALADAHVCKEIFRSAFGVFGGDNSHWHPFMELYLFHTSDWQTPGNIPSEMMPIVNACRHGTDIMVEYIDSRGAQTTRRVTPIQMLRIRQVPYLIGYCHLRNALRNFRLDRISNWQLL